MLIKSIAVREALAAILVVASVVCFFPAIADNWHKAWDDEFAKTWVERDGFREPTYLCGALYWEGFDYYVTREYGEAYKNNVHDLKELDVKKMPETFWLWRTNWGGSEFDEIISVALEAGYREERVLDHGDYWQLVRLSCTAYN